MNQMLAFLWEGNPILADLGAIKLRYYSLLFAGGIFLCYIYMKQYLTQYFDWEEKKFDRLSTYIILGTIAGARIGHCVFYEPAYYLPRPWEIFLPFTIGEEGFQFTGFQGLASHGAAAGILFALFLFCRKYKENFIALLDKLILVIPLAGACIRLGNFFNSEIVGSQTDSVFGVIFARHFTDGQSDAVLGIARHPAQLYESILCVIIFLVAHNLRFKPFFQQNGRMAGFVIGWIFIWRFILEFFKENQVAFEEGMSLNMGQWLSIPLVILSLIILFRKKSTNANKTT